MPFTISSVACWLACSVCWLTGWAPFPKSEITIPDEDTCRPRIFHQYNYHPKRLTSRKTAGTKCRDVTIPDDDTYKEFPSTKNSIRNTWPIGKTAGSRCHSEKRCHDPGWLYNAIHFFFQSKNCGREVSFLLLVLQLLAVKRFSSCGSWQFSVCKTECPFWQLIPGTYCSNSQFVKMSLHFGICR